MKNLNIPYIEGLEALSFEELDKTMELSATKDFISTVNWSGFPYKPTVSFRIARSASHIVIIYNVRGLDLRAAALEDNGPVWEDSCCEFFVSHPSDGTYYNFELNCIGTLLAAKRKSRSECRHLDPPSLNKVLRFSTLPREEIEIADEVMKWSNGMFIPFSLIGIDGSNPPETLRLNIYKCGDKTAHPHFLSWAPIHTEKPDFHRPEFFGTAIIER